MAKIERTKNATRNIVFGIVLKVYQIVIPFVMRTAMIYLLGVQYLGLNSLFTSVLQVLNLAELGVGSAMVFSMYKPIAEDDHTTICALMKLYQLYYRVIGIIIAVVGLAITPFITKLINGDVPADINVYVLYLLYLAATVASYWLLAYKNSILQAHQRTDIVSKVTLVTNTIQYVLQFLVLWLLKNYYAFVIVALFTQVLTNIVTAIAADRMYPQYKANGKLRKETVAEINQRIRDLFTSKVGSIIYDSADTIVISAFLGLTMLAVYQNYFVILNSITGFVLIVLGSCTAGIGNSIIVESKEKNYNDFKKFTFIISWIAGVCSCCLLCLYQPFMEIWVGKELMLPFACVVCFTIYFFVRQLNLLFNMYKDSSGMWHEDRWRPLVAALTNLVLNLILVQYIGIYGIVLSTVIAILGVGMPWLLHNLFSVIFERKYMLEYLAFLFKLVLESLSICVASVFLCSKIVLAPWLTFGIRLFICITVPNVLFILLNIKGEEFKGTIELFDRMTKGNLKLMRFMK